MRTFDRLIALAAAAIAVVLACSLTTAGAQGVPGVDPNKCLSGKTKCVNKKIAGLLKCREKCQNKPANCGVEQTDCEARVRAKFDGGTKGEAKSCFEKLEAKENPDRPPTVCTTKEDLAAIEAKADVVVAGIVSALEAGTRFVDNGDGTVTDNATGLQWEKKVAGGGCLHCVYDVKTWAAAMSEWISEVNGYWNGSMRAGLGGHSDWRLPSFAELQTILIAPYPCGTSPCVDPIFGPTVDFSYWSATTFAGIPHFAMCVYFNSGAAAFDNKDFSYYVRAVRSGP